jgi:prepilin-type N-terminal cleavage/methylation domain-containing protein
MGDVRTVSAKKDQRGFTLVEIIAVLIIIGIIAAVAMSKMLTIADTNRISQESVIKNHIRFAQGKAMKRGEIWGIKCNGAAYWLFKTNAPDAPANQISLPDEDTAQVSLAGKNITMSVFTVFFDGYGRPYTAYTDATTNTPLAAPLTVTIGSLPPGSSGAFTMAPETGFIP